MRKWREIMFDVFTICVPSVEMTNLLSKESIYIAVDVLRAGTSVCTALFNGAKEIIPAENSEKAISIAERFDKEMILLAGERNCQRIDGFDLGNSPLEFSKEIVTNKVIVLSTTNGSAVFARGKQFKYSFVAAFVNISAIVSKIVQLNKQFPSLSNILLVCAGNDGNFSMEDFLFCGAFIESLKKFDIELNLDDASKAAQDLLVLHKNELKEYLMSCEHCSKLLKLGFADDIHFSLTLDKFDIVPSIVGTSIVVGN